MKEVNLDQFFRYISANCQKVVLGLSLVYEKPVFFERLRLIMQEPCHLTYDDAASAKSNTEKSSLIELTLMALVLGQRYYEIRKTLKFCRLVSVLPHLSVEACKYLISKNH